MKGYKTKRYRLDEEEERELSDIYSKLAKIRAERAIASEEVGDDEEAEKNLKKYKYFRKKASKDEEK